MPIMPWIHDALYVGGFAGLVLVARQALMRRDLRLSGLPGIQAFRGLRRDPGMGSAPRDRSWTASPRPTGNTAFDAWRDGEIARIEGQRRELESRLHDFEGFVDRLRRAKDRETFERFMAERPSGTEAGTVDGAARPARDPA